MTISPPRNPETILESNAAYCAPVPLQGITRRCGAEWSLLNLLYLCFKQTTQSWDDSRSYIVMLQALQGLPELSGRGIKDDTACGE